MAGAESVCIRLCGVGLGSDGALCEGVEISSQLLSTAFLGVMPRVCYETAPFLTYLLFRHI